MKKLYSNNSKKIILTFLRKLFSKTPVFLLISFLTLFLSGLVYAQEQSIYQIDGEKEQFLQTIQNDENIDAEKLSALMFEIQPTAYFSNSALELKTGGNRPVTKLVFNDIVSLDQLKFQNNNLSRAELIVVKVKQPSELNVPVNFSDLMNINRLKYVYVQCSFKCTEKEILSFITETMPGVVILFSASTPL